MNHPSLSLSLSLRGSAQSLTSAWCGDNAGRRSCNNGGDGQHKRLGGCRSPHVRRSLRHHRVQSRAITVVFIVVQLARQRPTQRGCGRWTAWYSDRAGGPGLDGDEHHDSRDKQVYHPAVYVSDVAHGDAGIEAGWRRCTEIKAGSNEAKGEFLAHMPATAIAHLFLLLLFSSRC